MSASDHSFGHFARIVPEKAHVLFVPLGKEALGVATVDSNKKPHVSRRNDAGDTRSKSHGFSAWTTLAACLH